MFYVMLRDWQASCVLVASMRAQVLLFALQGAIPEENDEPDQEDVSSAETHDPEASSAEAREEVETRKIGRNETRTFQALFPGCTQVNKKPGKEPDMIVSFLMKRAWRADCLFLFPMWKRNTSNSNVSFGFRFNSAPRSR